MTSQTTPSLNRRTIVRGAAWTTPVVAVAVAAPQFAASAPFTVSGFTATYLNNPNPATVDPRQLVVAATMNNPGPQATIGAAYALTIPAGLYYSAPTATTPAGWGAPMVTGSGSGPWTLTYPTGPAQQIPAAGSKAFSTTITFTDTLDRPFRRWAGDPFTLGGLATANNAPSTSPTAPVAQTPDVTFDHENFDFDASVVHGYRAQVRLVKLWNAGRSRIGGRIQIEVRMPPQSAPFNTHIFENGVKQQLEGVDTTRWTFVSSNVNSTGGLTSGTYYSWIYESVLENFSTSTGVVGGDNATDGPLDSDAFIGYVAPYNRTIGQTGVLLSGVRGINITAARATALWLNDNT